jgi:cysteine desulfurase
VIPLGSLRMLYLDHAAATPPQAEVLEAMAEVRQDGFANPASSHAAGRRARRLLEDARDRLLAALGTTAGRTRLVFTASATEANQTAVAGLGGPEGIVASSDRDHPGLLAAGRLLAAAGRRLVRLPLDAGGRVDPDGLQTIRAKRAGETTAAGSQGRVVLCSTLACSQSGILEDLPRLHAALCGVAGRDGLLHVDATQAVGRVPVEFDRLTDRPGQSAQSTGLTAASLALGAHKLGGPRGIGALLVRRDLDISALLEGTQEAGLRGGTEAVTLAVGFAKAVEIAVARQAEEARRLAALRDRLERSLTAAAREHGIEAVVVGREMPRVPHVSVIAFCGLDRQAIVMAADLAGVCISSGTACASGSSEPSAALVAMGLPADLVGGAVRLSLGHTTQAEEVEQAARILRNAVFNARR